MLDFSIGMLWVYRMIGNGFFSENPKELDIPECLYTITLPFRYVCKNLHT